MKFKIGDLVMQRDRDGDTRELNNKIGTIVITNKGRCGELYGVEFKDFDSYLLHNLDNLLTTCTGRWYNDLELKLCTIQSIKIKKLFF